MKKLTYEGRFAEELSYLLKLKLEGPNAYIGMPAGLDNFADGSIITIETGEQFNKINFDQYKRLLVITCLPVAFPKHISVFRADNPLYYFLYIAEHYSTRPIQRGFHRFSEGGETSQLVLRGNHVAGGCYIEPGVHIGEACVILQNNVISGRTSIGSGCLIEPNCVIGNTYYRHVMVSDKVKTYPYLGSLQIGDNVVIGANCVIESGTDDNTIIGMNAVIKNSVTIGCNCQIEEGAEVPAGTVLEPYTHFAKKDSVIARTFKEAKILNEKRVK